MDSELTEDQLREAAGGDVSVLAVLMLVGTVIFAGINLVIGTMGWLAAALAVSSTMIWTVGLLRRNPVIASFVKIGFGFSGLAAPLVALGGVGLALIADASWGWAVVGAALVYFLFSLLGLEIIDRAQQTGAIETFEM